MCFGFGTAICPGCYQGEQPFVFFDDSYWLNRLMMIEKHRGNSSHTEYILSLERKNVFESERKIEEHSPNNSSERVGARNTSLRKRAVQSIP
jgi:hypothetical protein